jgi:hypothetical protein
MHGAADQRVRMTHHARFIGRPVVGLFEERFQLSGWAIEQVRLDAARH